MSEQDIQQPSSKKVAPTQIQGVLDKLRTIGPEIFQPRLDAKAQEVDPTVGIAIVPLPDQGSVVAGDGQEYRQQVIKVVFLNIKIILNTNVILNVVKNLLLLALTKENF